jgi:hypothetical protein
MAFKTSAASFLFKYIWPPAIFAEVRVLFEEWQRSDVKNKALLGVFFFPAILSIGGLLLCIAYFVLFKLPSFILSVLGWLLLISLFSGGGLFCSERLLGRGLSGPSNASSASNASRTRRAESDDYDYEATVTAEDAGAGARRTSKTWFNRARER